MADDPVGDTPVTAAPRIALDDLTIAYGRQTVLEGVSGQFEPGSFTAVVGPNGAGKSTLLKAIAGMLAPRRGYIHIGGESGGHALAYLPQIADIDRTFPISVADMVMAGAWRQVGAWGGMTPAVQKEISEALAKVGLEGFGGRSVGSLSGGQFQRVLFARLLLQAAPVILLDEPFTAMDVQTTRDLLALLHQWHEEGRTVIAALHDLAMVCRQIPQTLLLSREVIAWGHTATVLNASHRGTMQHTAENWRAQAEHWLAK
jgi:zinc/manganese transport system ATP-binding protein